MKQRSEKVKNVTFLQYFLNTACILVILLSITWFHDFQTDILMCLISLVCFLSKYLLQIVICYCNTKSYKFYIKTYQYCFKI